MLSDLELKQKIQDFIKEGKINVADEQETPKNPLNLATRVGYGIVF